MFKNLFGSKDKKPKMTAEEAKAIEKKKSEFEIKKTKEDLSGKIQDNENKINAIESQIKEKTQLAL